MSCNSVIHNELKNMGELTCPFCDQQLAEVVSSVVVSCCSNQEMFNDDGENVCLNCGSVHGYDYCKEYVDFYENMYKIRRKSVYHRKYHIENVMNSICCENGFQISLKDNSKILKIFKEIDKVLPLVNKNRKRMISTKFVLKKIFLMLGLPFENITITNSKKTLKFYDQYWVEILLLRFDVIIGIIRQ